MAKQLGESILIGIKNMKVYDNKYACNLIIKEARKVFNLKLIILSSSNGDNFNVYFGTLTEKPKG